MPDPKPKRRRRAPVEPPKPLVLTNDDATLAALLHTHTEGDLGVVGGKVKGFMRWDGQRWEQSERPSNDLLRAAVKATVLPEIRRLESELAELPLDADDALVKLIQNEIRALERIIGATRQQRRVESAYRYFAHNEDTQLVGQFDAQPHLVNFSNGTFDWHDWEQRDFDKADLLTKRLDHAYNPKARRRAWRAFLASVVPDPEHQAFLQEFVGYSLFGFMDAKLAVLLHGPTNTGKTTFQEVLRIILGDYAAVLPKEALFYHGDRANQALAKLQGVRFASASEVGLGRVLNAEAMKAMTSPENVSARVLYGEFFEYVSQFKILVSTNTLPTIEQDDATWGRLVVVPFLHEFGGAAKDTRLRDRLVGEAEGVLAWAMAGAQRVQERGGDILVPESLLVERAAHRAEQDLVWQFLDDECELGVDFACVKTSLYGYFVSWCRTRQIPRDLMPAQGGPSGFGARVVARLKQEFPDQNPNKRGNAGDAYRGVGYGKNNGRER